METQEKNIKGFMLIYSGQIFSLFGSSLVRFALIWWLTQLTGSAQVLATASLMAFLPDLVIGPFAGVLVDRLDRKKIMIAADGFTALATGVLAILYLRGSLEVTYVYGLLLARSLGTAFHFPAMESSIALMVPKNQLQRVSGLKQSVNGLINIVGPPVSAFLIAFLPLEWILAIDIVTALVAILPLLVTSIPSPENKDKRITVSSVLSDFKAGFDFLLGWKSLLLFALMIMLVHIVVIPAMSLMPLLVTDIFGGEATEFALIESVFGVGVLIGGLTLTAWGGFRKKTKTIISSLILCGVGFLIVWMAPSAQFYIGILGTFIFAFSVSIVAASIGALQQTVIPSEIQGRVFTLIRSATNAMPALGLAIAGPITESIGIKSWYLAGGLVFIIVGVAAGLIRDVRDIEEQRVHGDVFEAQKQHQHLP
ncbi:MAG: MFS transporter [Candidatus Bathyarchaeota archaeon]|nr:MFS transporter [Candidatus Bathyarchaeota archaeon]